MRCRTTVTIKATTAKPTDAQNSGQFWGRITSAIAPMMNASRPMAEPVHAATVRPWCTCLPRRFTTYVMSARCSVPAMAPSFLLIGICILSTNRPGLPSRIALLPAGVLHCGACGAILHIGVWHLGLPARVCGGIESRIHRLPQLGWIVGGGALRLGRPGLETIGCGWPGRRGDHGQNGAAGDQYAGQRKDPRPNRRGQLECIRQPHPSHLAADCLGT